VCVILSEVSLGICLCVSVSLEFVFAVSFCILVVNPSPQTEDLFLFLLFGSWPRRIISTMFSIQQNSSFRPERIEVEKSASLPPSPTRPLRKTTSAKSHFITTILFTALTLSPPPAHAQGCTQCLDNTAATPPATQRAYRHAIILLTLTAGGLFVTTLALFKRHR
jgi:hypothetical protein